MTAHSPADDLVYDLVSIQYHALKGAQLCEQFRRDAAEHPEVSAFIDRVQQEYARRATECHELLHTLTHDHGIAGDDGPEGVGLWTDSPGVGEGAAPPDGEGLGAGATSAAASTGTVEGGGTRTGISAVGEDEGTGGAEGATGDSADGMAGLNAEGPAARGAASGAAAADDDVDLTPSSAEPSRGW